MSEKLKGILYVGIPMVVYYIYSRYIGELTHLVASRFSVSASITRLVLYVVIGAVMYLVATMRIHNKKAFRSASIAHFILALFPFYATYLMSIPYVSDYMRVLGDATLLVEMFAGAAIVNFIQSFR